MSLYPTRLARAVLVAAGLALVLGLALGRPGLFALALPLLVALLGGGVRGRLETPPIELVTNADTLFESADLAVTVHTRAPGAGCVAAIIPALPPLFRALEGRRSPELATQAGEALAWRCRGRCEAAGILHFDRVVLRILDRSGLWEGEFVAKPRRAVTVLPRALPVSRLPRPFLTAAPFGGHEARAIGEGVSFAEVRPFAPGDRLRAINWPVSLRRQVLHANRFHTDRQAEIVLLVDSFTVIGARPDSSLDHVLRAAAAFAAAYLRRHDRVGLLEYGGIARVLGAGSGERQYWRILEALARAVPIQTEFAQDLSALPERILSRRALVLALTPLADERFDRAVIRLAQRGQDIVVLALVTDALTQGVGRPQRLEPIVRGLWRLEREERLRALRQAGVRTVNWPAAAPLDATTGRLLAEPWRRLRSAA